MGNSPSQSSRRHRVTYRNPVPNPRQNTSGTVYMNGQRMVNPNDLAAMMSQNTQQNTQQQQQQQQQQQTQTAQTVTVRNDLNVRKKSVHLLPLPDAGESRHLCFTADLQCEARCWVYFTCHVEPCNPDQNPPIAVLPDRTFGPLVLTPGLMCHVECSGVSVDVREFTEKVEDSHFHAVILLESTESPVRRQWTFLEFESADSVKVVRQRIQVNDGKVYELQEIYGLEAATKCSFVDEYEKRAEDLRKHITPSSNIYTSTAATATTADDDDDAALCVICMCESRNTTVLPCRHLCLCSECAQRLRVQTNKCPICRTQIQSLLEIRNLRTNLQDIPSPPPNAAPNVQPPNVPPSVDGI